MESGTYCLKHYGGKLCSGYLPVAAWATDMKSPKPAVAESPACFEVSVDGNRLSLRSYPPAVDHAPGGGVVLLHGLLSSADIFDVPGLEPISLARTLRDAGMHAVSYDQRGAGESTARNWQFGLREHAEVDLPAVLSACRERFGLERVVLMGHSLGGTIWLRYVQRSLSGADQPQVVAGVAVASPSVFNGSAPPWSDFARRGRSFVEKINRKGDGIISREDFAAAQIRLYWPWAAPIFSPGIVGVAIRLGSASRLFASVIRRLPIPSLLYHRDDFDDRQFWHVLRSKVLDRGPHTLLLELIDQVLAAPRNDGHHPLPEAQLPIETLCVGSTLDRLVPFRDVRKFAVLFARARLIATEQEFGMPSGHAGYMFKTGLVERLFPVIVGFVKQVLERK